MVVTLVEVAAALLKLELDASGAACLTFQRPTAPAVLFVIDDW